MPRFDERWPPVLLTDSSTNARSSSASSRSCRRSSLRRSAGSLIVSRRVYGTSGRGGRAGRADGSADCTSVRSELPGHDEVGEVAQSLGPRAESLEGGVRIATEPPGELARAAEAERGDVGRLALRRVLARGLAERRGRRLGVEDVVDDLEREADAFRVAVQTVEFPRPQRFAATGAEHDRGADQRPGL